jgi:hypothetical protein
MILAHFCLRLCAAAVLIATSAAALPAQQFSISHKRSSTALPELSGASGFDFSAKFPATRFLLLGAGIHHQTRDTELTTDVCVSYERRVGCFREPTRREARISGLAVTAATPLQLLPHVAVELGTGITLSQVRADDRTESGRPNALFTRPTGQWGLLATALVRVQPVQQLPISVHAGYGQHFLRLRSCGEYAWDDDPFCGSTSLGELRVGAALSLRR